MLGIAHLRYHNHKVSTEHSQSSEEEEDEFSGVRVIVSAFEFTMFLEMG